MRAIAVAVLLFASAAADATNRFYFGTIHGEEVHLLLRDGEALGATWWPAEEPRRTHDMPVTTARLVTGTHDGNRLVLREWDDGFGPERSLIEARVDGQCLAGTWRRHGTAAVRFEFMEGEWNSDLVRTGVPDAPYDRLHAAIRADNWPVARQYAQLVTALTLHGKPGWVEAVEHLAAGKTPPRREGHMPWQGIVLEREGRVADAINWWRVECWAREHISCVFLADYFPPSREQKLQEALVDAAHRGDAATVVELLRQGVDVNAGEHRPLYAAVEGQSLEVVILLLAAGADPNFGTRYHPPIAVAIHGSDTITLLLLHHGAKAGDELWEAVYFRRKAVVRKILANGEHPDASLVPAGSPLTAAVDNGDVELVRELLAHGADPEIETNHSRGSPIDHAREQGRKKILRMLLAAKR